MNSINVTIIKEKIGSKFKRGDIVFHDRFGEGIVVGFSSITSEPFVFLYDACDIYGQQNVCVDQNTLTLWR